MRVDKGVDRGVEGGRERVIGEEGLDFTVYLFTPPYQQPYIRYPVPITEIKVQPSFE